MELKVTKEKVLEASEKCSTAKNIFKVMFPEVFKNKETAVVGKWYNVGGLMINFQGYGNGYCFGINRDGEWSNSMGFHDGDEEILSTAKEIESNLIKIANKKGFKAGVKCKLNVDAFVIPNPKDIRFSYYQDCDVLDVGGYPGNIYINGKWATIIKDEPIEITLEEIAKLKGCNVSQIKIVD